MGRETLKTPEMMKGILDLIIAGHNISTICSKKGMPGRRTVQRWLLEDAEFYKAYKKAVSLRAHETLLDIFAIADRPKRTFKDVASDRLRVNARLRVAGLLNPALRGRGKVRKRSKTDKLKNITVHIIESKEDLERFNAEYGTGEEMKNEE